MKISKRKLIYIEWADALSSSTWKTEKEALAWGKNQSWITNYIGWLMEETKEYIFLASEWCPDKENGDMFNHLQKIPKGWIKKKKVLKY